MSKQYQKQKQKWKEQGRQEEKDRILDILKSNRYLGLITKYQEEELKREIENE